MKKGFFITIFILLSLSVISAQEGDILSFKFAAGDKSRILSTVNEDVYVNGQYSHTSEILNRISSEITTVDENGSGECRSIFMTSENSTNKYNGRNYNWGEEYESIFTRNTRGQYDIKDIYFMPTVRDVPVFPETPVKPGDTWTAEGHEAHDLRRSFDMQTPFKVPFAATYKYLGDETNENGDTFNIIEIKYQLYFESPVSTLTGKDRRYLPAITTGYSNQKLWWNNTRGAIDHYSEDFKISIETYSGDRFVFVGTAHAEVTDFERVNTVENLQKISETINQLGIENVDVKKGEKGLTISIENIQFKPDSYELMPSEKEKLQKIAEILKGFDNDLLITGHCAKRGTYKNQMRISEERAASVAGYLTELEVRDGNCIFTQGKGANEPVDTNDTETGRARNRRVEITIMDN